MRTRIWLSWTAAVVVLAACSSQTNDNAPSGDTAPSADDENVVVVSKSGRTQALAAVAPKNIGTVNMPFDGTLSAAVYDGTGQIVRTTMAAVATNSGSVNVTWDGRDDYGNVMPSGNYKWKALATRAKAVEDGQVGEGATPPYGPGEFSKYPSAVAVDSAGNVYEASFHEETEHDVRSWSPSGSPRWGLNIDGSSAIAVDDNYFYLARAVGQNAENRVERFPIAGNSPQPVAWIASPTGHLQANTGIGNAVFGLAVDGERLWVSNAGKQNVQLYNKVTGQLLKEIAVTDPRGIVTDGAGNAWVACQNDRVVKYSSTGEKLATIGGLGKPFTLARGGAAQHLYIGEATTGSMKEYDVGTSPPTVVRELFGPAAPGPVSDYALRWQTLANYAGMDALYAGGIAVDASGTIVVADPGNHRVQIYDANGVLRRTRCSEGQTAPQVTLSVDPNLLLSTWMEYAVDYSDPSKVTWRVANNWLPAEGKLPTQSAVRRRLSNGRDYIYWFGIGSDYEHGGPGLGLYQIGADGRGLRRSAIIGGDDGLYNWTDTSGDGEIGPGERVTHGDAGATRPPYRYLGPASSWWVDEQGNAWIANWDGAAVKLPIQGFDGATNPVYDWAARVEVLPKDATLWAFNASNMRVDPKTGDIYRIGTTSQAPTTDSSLWMGGTAIERSSSNGTRLGIFPDRAPDKLSVVATDTDGRYFYTGHARHALEPASSMWIDMLTNDGLLVTTARTTNSGTLDHGLALTAFTHPANGKHYIYGEEVLWGKSVRWRIDELESLQRPNPGGELGTSFGWTAQEPVQVVSVMASTATTSETGVRPGVFTIARTNRWGNLDVCFTMSGTATLGSDYTALPACVSIPNGSDSVDVLVKGIDDAIHEGDETAVLSISPSSNYTIGSASASVTIFDSDVNVTASVVDGAISEAGTHSAVFRVTRDNSSGELTVRYTVGAPKARVTSVVATTSVGSRLAENVLDGKRDTIWNNQGHGANSDPVDPAPELTFAFDKSYRLGQIRVANSFDPHHAQRGVKDVDVEVSTDGANYTLATKARLQKGPATDTPAPFQTVELGGVDARYVRLKVRTNWSGQTFGPGIPLEQPYASATYVALAEVEFYAVGASSDDFRPVTGMVPIPNGSFSADVLITPVDDMLIEGPEDLQFRVDRADLYTPADPSAATVSIADNDTGPSVSIVATGPNANEDGRVPGVFTVSRTGSTSGPLTVTFTTATIPLAASLVGATSTLYTTHIGTLQDGLLSTYWMSAGHAQQAGNDDNPSLRFSFDQARTIGRMRVSNANGGDYYRGINSVDVLVSNDGVNFSSVGTKTFSVGSTDPNAGRWQDIDLGGVTTSHVKLAAKTNHFSQIHGPGAVDWVFGQGNVEQSPSPNASIAALAEVQFFTGSTASNEDFTPALIGSVTIPAGKSSYDLILTPVDDALAEGPETLTLTLTSDNTKYIIGGERRATVTINDNEP